MIKRIFLISIAVCCLFVFSRTVFSKDDAPEKNSKFITGILTEVTQMSITIRTQDGKETEYMRGFKLKMPEKAGKGSLVTIRINPILNVVKSVELGTGKGK